MMSEAEVRKEQGGPDSDGEELHAEDPEFEIKELIEAEAIETVFYSFAPDPVVEIFRDDLLQNQYDGTPRPEWEKEALKRAWKTARDYLLPG